MEISNIFRYINSTKLEKCWYSMLFNIHKSSYGTPKGPFSYQKFSPKNFHLPFKHMYETLNVIK